MPFAVILFAVILLVPFLMPFVYLPYSVGMPRGVNHENGRGLTFAILIRDQLFFEIINAA